MRKSMEDLTEFANMGHRVMLVCERQLTAQECSEYLERVSVLHPQIDTARPSGVDGGMHGRERESSRRLKSISASRHRRLCAVCGPG
jgi:hypothetical protein